MQTINSYAERAVQRQKLHLSNSVYIYVRKKAVQVENGSTPYYFSYSFKGDKENDPIMPKNLMRIARKLTEKLQKNGQTLIAFDRGGTALGIGLAILSNLPLFIAFSYAVSRNDGIYWSEPGGGKYLGIPKLPKKTHVILIDDEINTGKTFLNAIDVLRENSIVVDQILVVVEIQRKGVQGRHLIEQTGCQLDSIYSIPEPIYDSERMDYYFTV